LKAHLPIACQVVFKLEGAAGANTELSTDVTVVNEWTQLSFDFAGAASNTYNKIVIFFDFATSTDNTFYFDDVEGPEYGGGGTGDPVYLPVTFDDDEVNYALTDFGGNVSEIIVDPDNADNKIAKSIKTDAAAAWAGTTVGGTVGFAMPVPFAEGATTMTVAVYSPAAGTPIRLKVEDAGDVTITCETETLTTMANAWEILTFDFSNEAPGTATLDFSKTYNKASVFFNFGTDGATAGEQTYYWDDMEFMGVTGISDNSIIQANIYPNPVTDFLLLENAENFQNVNIYSIRGQLIYQSETINSKIDLKNIPAGFYTLHANGIDGKQYQAKFIVK